MARYSLSWTNGACYIWDEIDQRRIASIIDQSYAETLLTKLNQTPADVVKESLLGPGGVFASEEVNVQSPSTIIK